MNWVIGWLHEHLPELGFGFRFKSTNGRIEPKLPFLTLSLLEQFETALQVRFGPELPFNSCRNFHAAARAAIENSPAMMQDGHFFSNRIWSLANRILERMDARPIART